jgi:hypothetical protein
VVFFDVCAELVIANFVSFLVFAVVRQVLLDGVVGEVDAAIAAT